MDDTNDSSNEGKDRVRILCGATGPVAEGCVPRVNALSTCWAMFLSEAQ